MQLWLTAYYFNIGQGGSFESRLMYVVKIQLKTEDTTFSAEPLISQVWLIFSSVTYFLICDSYFQGYQMWRTCRSVPHFSNQVCSTFPSKPQFSKCAVLFQIGRTFPRVPYFSE